MRSVFPFLCWFCWLYCLFNPLHEFQCYLIRCAWGLSLSENEYVLVLKGVCVCVFLIERVVEEYVCILEAFWKLPQLPYCLVELPSHLLFTICPLSLKSWLRNIHSKEFCVNFFTGLSWNGICNNFNMFSGSPEWFSHCVNKMVRLVSLGCGPLLITGAIFFCVYKFFFP